MLDGLWQNITKPSNHVSRDWYNDTVPSYEVIYEVAWDERNVGGAKYLNGDCHELFQVIFPALCGKTNKTSRYHGICRSLYINSPTYRLSYLCIFLPGGLKSHATVQTRMQGWSLSGNSRTGKHGSRYKRELTSFTSTRHFLSKQWQIKQGTALFFWLSIAA